MEKSENRKRVAIVGAGISGLAAAWELSTRNVDIHVFERDAMAGGLAGWFDVGGTTLEKFYHHIYNRDTDLINIIGEAGLGNELVFKKTVTGCFYVNKIYRLSSPMDLLKYKPLSFPDRIRLGLLAVKARFVKDWRDLDTISAKEWIIKNSSRNVFEILWEPLFRSKFGQYSGEVSAAWLWSKLVQRGGSRSKGGAEELGYLKGGYGLLFDNLMEKLAERGVNVHLNAPVDNIGIADGTANAVSTGGDRMDFDAVIASTQIPDYLKIAGDLPKDNFDALSGIGFLGNSTLVLQLKRRLSDTYWVNVTDVNCPFVGVIEQTNLLGEENYQGHHLAYISRYMDTDDPYYRMDADELFKAYLPYIQKVFPAFSEEWVERVVLWKEPYTQAVVSVGYNDRVPEARTPVKNLYLSTMAQIFPEDRQMSNGVKKARETARMLARDLGLD